MVKIECKKVGETLYEHKYEGPEVSVKDLVERLTLFDKPLAGADL